MAELNLGSLLAGALLGFGATQIHEWIRRYLKRKEQQKRGLEILEAILVEVRLGIKRCETLIQRLEDEEVSFSRIYTGFWDSLRSEVPTYIKNMVELKNLHNIYYIFDLVNFNMNMGNYGAGAAFAKFYRQELYSDFLEVLNRFICDHKLFFVREKTSLRKLIDAVKVVRRN
jgi:hypothetical protein